MVYLYDACDQISVFCHQQLLRKVRRKISWTDGQTDRGKTVHIEYICTFFVTFFSATIDGRNLIFGHKLHIGTPYRGKRFWTHQIPMLTYDTPALRQTGSRNLTGQKTLPTIWGTYMKLVTKYQISAINSC
jgi:hypothetical protein